MRKIYNRLRDSYAKNKKTFVGTRHQVCPEQWSSLVKSNSWLQAENLIFDPKWSDSFFYVVHTNYQCFEFKRRVNLLTFGRFKLVMPITMIALPVSLDGEGFCGDIQELIRDYKQRFGLFLMLNIRTVDSFPKNIPVGNTLTTCVFTNNFDTFEDYKASMRSHYRRRLQLALNKSHGLKIQAIRPTEFDDELYETYLQVLQASQYPLETLPIDYFQQLKDEIYVFYEDKRKVAFVALKFMQGDLYFLFGGMNYDVLTTYDLYYAMLIFIVQQGIEKNVKKIYFGQTAESSKCRLGCTLEYRYMSVFTKYNGINWILRKVMPLVEYKIPKKEYHVFSDDKKNLDKQV